MILTELLVLGITLGTIHYSRKIIIRILADDAFDTHIFDHIDFTRKIQWEQDIMVNNLMYIFSVLFLFFMRIIVPFGLFEWYTWFHLYAIVQTLLVLRTRHLTFIDKSVSVSACIAYYFIPSNHMNNLILYSTLHMDPLVSMDRSLFSDKAYLKNYHQRLLRLDTVLFFVFWPLSLLSFLYYPCVIDVVSIPLSFYYQLYQKHTPLNNKKKV